MKKRKIIPIIALSTILGMGVVSITSCGNETTNPATYTVTYQESSDYTITGLESSYSSGATVSFTVTVNNSAKEIDSVAVNGSKLSGTGSYSFKMPSENVTIVVTLKDKAVDPAPVENELTAKVTSSAIYVGRTITLEVKFNGGAVNSGYTVTSADSTIVSVGEDGVITALKAGSTVLTVKYTSDGTEYTTTVNVTVEEDPFESGEAISTLNKESAVNLVDAVGGGVYNNTEGVSDKIDDVTFNYSFNNNFGFAGTYEDVAGYRQLGAFQAKKETVNLVWTTETIKVDKIIVTYLNTYDTFDNPLPISVGETKISTPVIDTPEKTGVMNKGFEVNTFKALYDFNDAEGVVKVDGGQFPCYFTSIEIFGEVTGTNYTFEADINTTNLLVNDSYEITGSLSGTPVSNFTVSANDPSAFEINGATIKPLKTGSYTLTIGYTDSNSKVYNDSINVTVSEDSMADKDVIEIGKFGLWQKNREETLYFNGLMDGFYLGSTTSFEEAVEVTAYKATENSVYLRITDGANQNNFIAAAVSGSGEDQHNNILMSTEAYEWTYNSEYDAYTSVLENEDEVYIGNYSSYDTFSLSTMDHITDEGTNIAHLVQKEIVEFKASLPTTDLALDGTYTITGKLNSTEVKEGLTVTASDPEAFEINGTSIKAIKKGSFTLTVTYNDGEEIYEDVLAVTVEEKIDGFVFTWTKGIGTVSEDGETFTFTIGEDMFDVKVEKNTSSSKPTNTYDEWRMYQNHLITISSEKVLITAVYFTDTNNKEDVSFNATSNNFTASNEDRDWTFTVNDPNGVESITFEPLKQVRTKEMIISYVEK